MSSSAAVLCFFLSFCVTTFVSRLASLARFSLEPAWCHCWTLIQLILTNVVLAIPCALILAHLQLQIYLGYSLTKIIAAAPDTLSSGCFLVGWHHLLFCLVRTCKNLIERTWLNKFVRKWVEQHLVLVQQKDFLLIIFSASLLTMIGRLKIKWDSCICYERLHPQRHTRTHQLEENEKKFKLRHHIPQLPSYSGEFDPKVYVN
jgi:hypothetical protein